MELALKGLTMLLNCEFVFLKIKYSIIIFLDSEFFVTLFTAKVKLAKKSVKFSFGTSIVLVNNSVLLSTSSILSQAFKAATQFRVRCGHYIKTVLYISIIALFKRMVLGNFNTLHATLLFNGSLLQFRSRVQCSCNQILPVFWNTSVYS